VKAWSEVVESLPPMKHILLVVDHFYPYVGGSETLYWNATRGLVAAGYRVTVVTRRDAGMAPEETLEGVRVYRVATPDLGQRLFFMLLAVPLLWRLSREADLIHAVVYGSALPAWLVAKLRRLPFLLTVHEVFGAKWRTLTGVGPVAAALLRAFEWLLLHLPGTHYVCVAEFQARLMQSVGGVARDKITVVHNVVDYDFWQPGRFQARDLRGELGLPADTFVYLYFGRPGPSKGVEVLVEAAAEVARRLPASHLVMLLGPEPADRHQAIVRRIAELNLQSHVTVLSPRPRVELPTWLLASDCVVIPSHSEGFGYSAVEAATIGCRVLSTRGHSVEEILAGEVDLVEPGNPAALAEKIVEIAGSPQPIRYAEQRYGLKPHVDATIRLYEKISASSSQAAMPAFSQK